MTTALATTTDLDLKTPFADDPKSPDAARAALVRAESIRGHALDLEREVRALRQEKIVALGDGEAFVRKDENGLMVSMKAGIPLRFSEDHIYAIEERSNVNGQWVTTGRKWKITAAGYQFINTVAGIQLITPPRIEVEGRSLPNPYVLRHEQEGRRSALREVHVRTIAFGRAASGNLVMADSYLIWRPISYLTTAVTALIGRKNVGDAVFMTTESEFNAQRAEGKTRGLAFWPIEEAGDDMIGVAAMVGNGEVIKQIKAHSERQKFGDRIARTICERNALKKLVGASTVNPRETVNDRGDITEAVAIVPIFAWAEPDSMLFKDGGVKRLLEQAKTAEQPFEVEALLESAKAQGAEIHEVREERADIDDVDDRTLTEPETQSDARDREEPIEVRGPKRRASKQQVNDDAGPLFDGPAEEE